MRGRKLVALLTSAMLGFQATMPISVALASESEATISQETIDYSYTSVKYDGKEQVIPLSETEELHLLGWKDETKQAVLVEYRVVDAEPISLEIPVVEEVTEFPEVGRVFLTEAEDFEVETKIPSVTVEMYLPVAVNEDGTSVEQAVIVDEAGLILDKKEDFQFVLEEGETRTLLTEEEYAALNIEPEEEVVDEEPVVEEEVVEEADDETTEEATEEAAEESEVAETTDEAEEPEATVEEEPVAEESVEEETTEEEAPMQIMSMMMAPMQAQITPSVTYSTHVQSHGWMADAVNGEKSGTEGESKRLEAIQIRTNMKDLGVTYSTHVEKKGWMPEVSNGAISGTVGEAKRLEAIKINLAGNQAKNYDIYYRVHAESYGWLDWAKNGEPAGTEGLAKRLEAIEIILVEKGGSAPGATTTAFITGNSLVQRPVIQPSVSYSSYVEGQGWMPTAMNGGLSGTSGQAKRIEAIRVGIENIAGLSVHYSTHVQSHGWLNWTNGAGINGLPGQGKRMEAIKLELTGKNAGNYDIYYRVHAERFGWLGWAKNGAPAGTEGYGFRAEAYEVQVVPKGTAFDQGGAAYKVKDNASVVYTTHIQSLGWLKDSRNGQPSGTTNRELRMEALKVSLQNDQYTGGVEYRTHVESHGWMNPVSNGAISGTTGQTKRVEAVQINLTGEMAQHYDIYYRVHSQSFGWLGWAKNGMSAGTEGMKKRVENIEIKLVEKGLIAPVVNEAAAFKKAEPKPEVKKYTVFVDVGHGGSDPGAQYFGTREKDLNLQMAFRLEKHLKAAGFNVILSRTNDVFIDHKTERSRMANASGADIFLSLHNNAMPGNSGVNGIETFWYEYDPDYEPKINGDMHNDPTRLRQSEKLAHAVHNSLISATGAFNRGVRRDTFAVLRETKLPAALLEFGFMSNQAELNKLKTASYQETLAKAVTNGVVNYFKN